jgi:asparagine synthase (glutamine-hydrolysing)
MSDMLVHRGPDDFGYLLLRSRDGEFRLGQGDFERLPADVCLGHRRLSIIDLSPLGRQPMSNETNDVFLVFNGEIFNYLELRDELGAKGHSFRSQTDTEVVIHAYEEWGADCVTRFNGMWALAIWDQRKRELFCSRDRFGIKPFYYYLDKTVFVFASEIKGILPALDTRPSADFGVLGDYLIDGTLCRTENTFFKGILRLPPAHNLIVSASGTRTSQYWDYTTRSQTYNETQPVETFRELLTDSIRLRLRSDVPVGIALSGGIDSSSILALASGLMGPNRPKAFTAVFPGESYNEYEYARIASQAAGAELFCVDYQPRRFLEDLSRVIWSMDYPALEGQVLSRWELMRLAGRHVKVVLEGQGADEMLAGYVARYFAPYLFDEIAGAGRRQNGLSFRELVGSCREVHRAFGWRAYRGLFRHLAPAALPLRTFRNLSASSRVYSPEFARLIPGHPEELKKGPFELRLTNLLHFDCAKGILPMLLKFGDALSMASSVESRLPFLDHRLVEYAFSLPAHFKLRGSQSKGILREAMAGVIPERIRRRTDKVGFLTPVARWIGESMDDGVRPLLLSKRCRDRGIFDVTRIERQLTQQARGQAHIENSIFRWVSLELWFRLFIDGDGIRPRVIP